MTTVTLKLESSIFNQPLFRSQVRTLVTKAALGVEAAAKISIQQSPKTGRIYRRRSILKAVGARQAKAFSAMGLRRAKGTSKFIVGAGFHRASAPGEPPATDSSHLANSIVAKPATVDATGIRAEVTVNARYGLMLEQAPNA